MLEEKIEALVEAITNLTETLKQKEAETAIPPVEEEEEAPKKTRRTRRTTKPQQEEKAPAKRTRRTRKSKEPEPEPEEDEDEDEEEIGLPQIRQKFRALVDSVGREAAVDVLADFNAKKVPDLDEEDYPEVAAAIDAAIEETED